MSLLQWLWQRKKEKEHTGHTFTQDDSEYGVKVRAMKRELKNLEFEKEKLLAEMELEKAKAELELLRERLYPTEEADTGTNPDQMLTQMLLMQMMKQNQNQQSVTGTVPTTTTTTTSITDIYAKKKYTDVELMSMKEQLPTAYLKKARKMSDSELIPLIKNNVPNIDDESIQRALILLRK